MNITEAIKLLRDEYLEQGLAPSYFEINNGLCDDFALDVINRLSEFGIGPNDFCGENFMRGADGQESGNDVWDWKLLKEHWNISPPKGLTKAAMNRIDFGGHAWLHLDGLHFDAECPEGVKSFFDLPLYRRSIVMALRKKGVAAEEVVTEDVAPAPLCPIPNPVI